MKHRQVRSTNLGRVQGFDNTVRFQSEEEDLAFAAGQLEHGPDDVRCRSQSPAVQTQNIRFTTNKGFADLTPNLSQ